MRILYFDIDALRPDHLGCYGYHRNTSPQIDALARESVRFTNYYTSDAPCLPSRTALYTGMHGIHSGVVAHGGTAADLRSEGANRAPQDRIEANCLPTLLMRQGFHTAQISPFAHRHAARQFLAGFNEVHNTGRRGMESAEEVTPVITKWLEDNAKKDNWFLHVNFWDVHTPYRAPAEYGEPFADDPLPGWLTDEIYEDQLKNKVGPHGPQEINMYNDNENPLYPRHPGHVRTKKDLRKMFDGYDTAIRYVDDQLGHIFKWLKENGLYEDTAIIISADHGENIGELGLYGEHATADNVTCKVPFIVKWPGMQKNTVDEGLHYNVDMAATFADLLGFTPSPLWDGKSYGDSLRSGENTGRDFLVLSQCVHVCQRGVRFGPWIYIRTYHDGFHLFPQEMLFNVEEDPHELHNQAEAKREVCNEALRLLCDWHDDMMSTMPYDTDPLWTVMKEGGPYLARGYLKGYCEFLEKTGRGWAIPELKRRHPREFVTNNP